MKNVFIIGAGAYGCALANVFAEKYKVVLISRSQENADYINQNHQPPKIKYIQLKENITCQVGLTGISDCVFICTPVAGIRDTCERLKSNLNTNIPVILCSKGIEQNTGLYPTQIATQYLDNQLFVFSGPSFAEEIANGAPAGVSLSSTADCRDLASLLSTSALAVIPNNDIIGTQICGAFKNVLAILCGVFSGLNLGKSAMSYLISKACQEIQLLNIQSGGQPLTITEPCGIGDIVLTCTNEMSRNMSFGQFLAKGGTIENWTGPLAEGAYTSKLLTKFNTYKTLYMSYEIIYNHRPPLDVINSTLWNK